MKLHTTNNAGLNIFTAHGEGFVAINHQRQEGNVIVTPDSLVTAWSDSRPDALNEGDAEQLLALGIGIVLLGTGNKQRFPTPTFLARFATAGIGLEVMDLPAACRTYNILASEGRKVAAALLFD